MNTFPTIFFSLLLSTTFLSYGMQQSWFEQDNRPERIALNSAKINRSSLTDRDRQHLLGYFSNITLEGHTDAVCSLAFSPDGKYLASGGVNGIIFIWNVTMISHQAQPQTILYQHRGAISTLCFSPNGKYFASGSYDKTICIWDTDSFLDYAQPLAQRWERDGIEGLCFCPDSLYLASAAGDDTICIWNMSDLDAAPIPLRGTQTAFNKNQRISSLSFSPNKKYLAAGTSIGTIYLWKWDIKAIENHCATNVLLYGHTADVIQLQFCPHSKHLASASNKETALWRITTLQPEHAPEASISHFNKLPVLCFSPNCQHLFSRFNETTQIGIWNTLNLYINDQEPEAIINIQGGHQIGGLCLTPDGHNLALYDANKIHICVRFCSLPPVVIKHLIKWLKNKKDMSGLTNDEQEVLRMIPNHARPRWLQEFVT